MDTLWIDLETRSKIDLPKRGLYNYAYDDSTAILIASWAINDEPVKRWMIFEPFPIRLHNALKNPKVQVRAHNAPFERHLIKACWHIDIPLERWYCTAMQARASALPASLEDLGRFLDSRYRKNTEGTALMRLLSMPQPDGTFRTDSDAMLRYGEYCDDDVRTMRACSQAIPALTDEALEVWRANEIVNDRGLPIDIELCELATHYAEQEQDEANANIKRLTGGAIASARSVKLNEWVADRIPKEYRYLMERTKQRSVSKLSPPGDQTLNGSTSRKHLAQGEKYDTLSLDNATREALALLIEENPEGFDDVVIDVLDAKEAASSGSTAKFQRMRDMASPDGRLRGAFVTNGASGTGRFSSKGAQLHNFPRSVAKDPEAILAIMRRHGDLGGPVLATLKSMLRPAISPGAGRMIVRGDWNAIEARALPWLTGRASAVHYLDAFRDPERDIYIEQAIKSGLGENRPAGKVVVLALGYGGGAGALTVMSKGYGVPIADKDGVKRRWREANRWAPEWWYELERCCKAAIRDGGVIGFDAGRATILGNAGTLRIELPSGRLLTYPYAHVIPTERDSEIRYAKAAWTPKAGAAKWPEATLWGGLCAENITQAACADLLRHALVQGVKEQLPIIGHVHDELICEGTAKEAEGLARFIEGRMLKSPAWATGLPLAVETDISPRFRK